MNLALRLPSLLLLFFGLILLNSCDKNANPSVPTDPPPLTVGLFSPIQLEPDSTVVYLEDYFPNGEWPDEIFTPLHLEQLDNKEKNQLIFKETGLDIPNMSLLELKFGSQYYHLLMKKSRKVRHVFSYESDDPKLKKVQIAGDITNWNPDNGNMVFNERFNRWELEMLLNPGVYQYQIVVDGEWILDPANPLITPNGMGGVNSQLAIGGSAEGDVEIPTFRVEEEDAITGLSFNRYLPDVFLFWENQFLELEVDDLNIRFDLPEQAKTMERSYLRLFVPRGHDVVDFLLPLSKGKVVRETEKLGEIDQHKNILYFMLVDRFFNGDASNDAPIKDERVLPQANYHGGDLAGIKAKLESGYFSQLGVNTLWISPLNQNPEEAFQEYPEPRRWFSGYHGYWPISSSKVDHRFGTNQELKDLVSTAHGKDTKVILDFVANHVHEQHPMIQKSPHWKTQLELEDGTKNIRIWDEQRLTTWFDTFLPSLDFSMNSVINTQVDSALYWLKEFDLDGFRHDATKHIPLTFWRRLQQRTKQEIEWPIFQVGETFGSRELIGSYVGSGMLDGQFDFNLYFDMRNALTSETPKAQDIVRTLDASLGAYGYHSLMGNISGNHDMPRFIAFAGKDLSPGEDPKEAGWSREVGVKDPVGYRKLEQLHAFLMVAPGIPVIYYGDEIGMSGADDPDNRRDMRFENLLEDEARVLSTVQKMVGLRKSRMALNYGQTRAFAADNEAFVLVREYLDEAVILVLNLANEDRRIDLKGDSYKLPVIENDFGDAELEINPDDNTWMIDVKANGFAVLAGKIE